MMFPSPHRSICVWPKRDLRAIPGQVTPTINIHVDRRRPRETRSSTKVLPEIGDDPFYLKIIIIIPRKTDIHLCLTGES
jgi:hypothetical protein